MISRIWSGWTTPQNADAYERLLLGTVVPGIAARSIPGYRGMYVQRRADGPEVEFVTTMLFDSLDAVRAFAGPGHETSVVPDAARRLLSRFDDRARHYEVLLAPEGSLR